MAARSVGSRGCVMGGWGSGSRRSASKKTSSYLSLDVRRLQREGLLTTGSKFALQRTRPGEVIAAKNLRTESNRLVLSYDRSHPDSKTHSTREYSVHLEWTQCPYGGKRCWFLVRLEDADGE
jgi:hypothetical protein